MKEAFTLFLLALLIIPPLWGIRRVRRVLRIQASERARQERGE
jgi:hypothetical protein